MRFISRFRSILANLQGFNLTLEVSQTNLTPIEGVAWAEPSGKFTYRGVGVPQAEVRVYVNEGPGGGTQTDRAGSYKSTPIGFPTRGRYRLIARVILAPRLVGHALVESNEVTVTVGYRLTIESATGGTTNPASGIYEYQVEDVLVTAIPASGYTFDHWMLDGVSAGKSNPVTVVMDADHTLTPLFYSPGEGPGPGPGAANVRVPTAQYPPDFPPGLGNPAQVTVTSNLSSPIGIFYWLGADLYKSYLEHGMYPVPLYVWQIGAGETQTRTLDIGTRLSTGSDHVLFKELGSRDCEVIGTPVWVTLIYI